MIDLADSKLLDILPPNLRNDPDIIAASKAVDKEFSSIVNAIKNIFTVADIKNASSDIINHIAVESHASYYDSSLDIEIRKDLARKAIEVNMEKGTPGAVEKLVSTIFADARIEEWFEYGGEPYKFKITTTERTPDEQTWNRLISSIYSVKNKRSWLDAIYINRENKLNNFTGGIVHSNANHCIDANYTIDANNNIDTYFSGIIHINTIHTISTQEV